MAQFRATIQGCRGEASRLGGKESGIRASVNGWRGGVSVEAIVNPNGNDEFRVYATGGSGYGGGAGFLGSVKQDGAWVPAETKEED